MKISPKALWALHYWFAALAFVSWNCLIVSAWWLNGWEKQPNNPATRYTLAGTLLATALVAAAIIGHGGLRQRLMHPDRIGDYEPAPYLLIAVICAMMGTGVLTGSM